MKDFPGGGNWIGIQSIYNVLISFILGDIISKKIFGLLFHIFTCLPVSIFKMALILTFADKKF